MRSPIARGVGADLDFCALEIRRRKKNEGTNARPDIEHDAAGIGTARPSDPAEEGS